MKKLFLIVLTCLLSVFAFAQEMPNVDDLLRMAKEKYPQVDTLDKISIKLHYFEDHLPSPEQMQKMIEIYKAIANGFAVNFHFKQGYIAYQKSLALKEKKLAAEKAAAITQQNKQYEQQNSNDEQQVANLQATQQQLSHDIDSLISKRKSFKSIFSIIIAVLSLLFAASLFKSGIKLKDLKNETTANRDKLMQNHRIALLGSLATGVRQTMISNNEKVKAAVSELLAKLPNDNKAKEIRTKLEKLAT
jgi:hypothetical protein